MKKNRFVSLIIVAALCVVVLALASFTLSFATTVGLMVVLIVLLFFIGKGKKRHIADASGEPCMQKLTDRYGLPDDTLITNPARGNELEGCMLVYREKGMFVINGREIKKSDITDYALKNDATTPYFPADYYLRITTTLDDCPMLSVSVGNEISWAEQVLMLFKEEMEK